MNSSADPDYVRREIARLNKAHVPAALRSAWIARLKAVAACMPRHLVGGEWCASCGYHRDDHLIEPAADGKASEGNDG